MNLQEDYLEELAMNLNPGGGDGTVGNGEDNGGEEKEKVGN